MTKPNPIHDACDIIIIWYGSSINEKVFKIIHNVLLWISCTFVLQFKARNLSIVPLIHFVHMHLIAHNVMPS